VVMKGTREEEGGSRENAEKTKVKRTRTRLKLVLCCGQKGRGSKRLKMTVVRHADEGRLEKIRTGIFVKKNIIRMREKTSLEKTEQKKKNCTSGKSKGKKQSYHQTLRNFFH